MRQLPCYHTVHYKGFAIHYANGLYKVPELSLLSYLDMNSAKAKVDEYEAMRLASQNHFPNQISSYAQNNSER